MRSSLVRGATLFAAAATLGLGFGVHAQAPEGIEAITTDTAVAPYAPRTAHGVRRTVMVLLSGDSVAAVQQRIGRELFPSERDAIRVARAFDHGLAKREIERRGGDVLATLYGALNGIKVSPGRRPQSPDRRVGRRIPGDAMESWLADGYGMLGRRPRYFSSITKHRRRKARNISCFSACNST